MKIMKTKGAYSLHYCSGENWHHRAAPHDANAGQKAYFI